MFRTSLCVVLLLLDLRVFAERKSTDELLPTKARLTLLFTSLTYDHNLTARCVDGIRLAVISLENNAESQTEAEQVIENVEKFKSKRIKGLGLDAISIPIASPGNLESHLEKNKINTIYLCQGLKKEWLESISKTKEDRPRLVLEGSGTYVYEGIAALSAIKRNQKARILVHMKAAQKQGAFFDPRLLRLADVVDGD